MFADRKNSEMKRSLLLGCLCCVTLVLLASNVDAHRRNGICSSAFYPDSDCHKDKFLCSNSNCINRGLYCNGRNDCGDNSDESSTYCLNTYCRSEMSRCPGTGICISNKWYCDGIKDCSDGSDEGPHCAFAAEKDGKSSKLRALQWLQKQNKLQSATEMWGPFVDKLAVARYLASDTTVNTSKETTNEMAYEASIQLLSKLSQRRLQDIPSSKLASYVNAFLVTCLNPRNFHGLNIIGELRSRVNRQNYTNPYVLLSLCNAGETITESDKSKLIDAFWSKRRHFWTDTQAVVIMALACAKEQIGNSVDTETLHELTEELKKRQYRNGTVENLQTTALVMQALLSSEPDADPDNFDERKALEQMIAMQKEDGSFGSFMNTYYVLPVLNCKSLVNISSDHCESSNKDEISALENLINRDEPKINVRYSLWIGDERELERQLTLHVPANMSFYGIMEMAAEIDSRYRFEYIVQMRKPYVNALSGLQDDPENGKFWFLYTVVDGKPTPSQESPADIIPKEHDHFVMWYRSGSWIDI